MAKDIKLARLLVLFEAETKGFKRDLAESERSLGRLTSFIKANPVAAMGALGAAAIAAGLKAAEMAREFDTSARKIAAVVPGATARVDDLKRAADRLSTSKGLSSEQVLGGLSEIAKQGVTSLEALTNRFEIIQRAADATGEDFNTLAQGFDQVLDVFGLTDDQLESVAARLTQIAAGRFPVQDLLAAFQTAAPTLKKAGISFDEGAAALGRFVAGGLNAKQSAAALKDEVERLGRQGLGGIPGNAEDAARALEQFRSRAAVVANDASRQAGALHAAFEQAMHKIGGAIDEGLLQPLQAGVVLLTNFKALKELILSGGNFAAAAGVLLERPLAPNAGHVFGHPGGLDFSRSKSGPEPLTEEEKQRAQAFADEVHRAAVKATRTMIDDLELVLGDFRKKFQENVRGLSAAQLAEAKAQLHELEAALKAVKDLEAHPLTPRLAGGEPPPGIRRDTAQDRAEQAEHILDVNKKITEEEKKRAEVAKQLKDKATQEAIQLERAVRGAVQLGKAFGLLDDQMANVLEGIGQVAAGIKDAIANGLDFSNALSIAGGFASVISGLFGETPDMKRDREIREQNTEALHALTKALVDQVTGTAVGNVGDAIAAILGTKRNIGKGITGGQPGLNTATVNDILKPFGLTIRELQDQLKLIDPNLTLNTSSAHDFVESLKQVQKALDSVQFSAFADTFAGKLSFLQLQMDLLDLTNPLDQLKALQNLASGESPIIKQLLGSLDLSSAQGRAEAEKQLLALLDKARTKGGLSGTDLGNLSESDILDLIKQMEGLIDQLKTGGTSGGSTTNFTSENRITETTGARLAGLAESQLAVQKEILAALTGTFLPITAPIVPFTGEVANAVSMGDVTVTVQFLGPVGDTAAAAAQVASATADQLDRLLGQVIQKRLAQLGKV